MRSGERLMKCPNPTCLSEVLVRIPTDCVGQVPPFVRCLQCRTTLEELSPAEYLRVAVAGDPVLDPKE